MITVTNEDGLVKVFPTDEMFLKYAQDVYKERECPYILSTIHWPPIDIRDAKEYIHEYCNDLELTEE